MIGSGPVGARGDDFRITTGLVWAPQPAGRRRRGRGDRDGDGIPDSVDALPRRARGQGRLPGRRRLPRSRQRRRRHRRRRRQVPDEPEDKDGFQDDDGCPEPDNDNDGIPDAADKCPNEAEDRDGFEDDDGCPDQDNDGDGIADADDKCPNEPETVNGFEDDDGCPDVRGDDRSRGARRIGSTSRARRSRSPAHRDADRAARSELLAPGRAAHQEPQAHDPRRGPRRRSAPRPTSAGGDRGAEEEGQGRSRSSAPQAILDYLVVAGRRRSAAPGRRPRLRSPARDRDADRRDQRARRLHQGPAGRHAMTRSILLAALVLGSPAVAAAQAHARAVIDIEVPTVVIEQGDATARRGRRRGARSREHRAERRQGRDHGAGGARRSSRSITADEIRDRQFQDLDADRTTRCPGWQRIGPRALDASRSPLVRGQVQAVQFLHDGCRCSIRSSTSPSTTRVQPMELIKRVEMITGPGGVLWGSNSLLGILNVITKDAEDVDGVEVGGTLGDGDGDRMMARAYVMAGKTDLLGGKLKAVRPRQRRDLPGRRATRCRCCCSTSRCRSRTRRTSTAR